jgi:hypothetical protein
MCRKKYLEKLFHVLLVTTCFDVGPSLSVSTDP